MIVKCIATVKNLGQFNKPCYGNDIIRWLSRYGRRSAENWFYVEIYEIAVICTDSQAETFTFLVSALTFKSCLHGD